MTYTVVKSTKSIGVAILLTLFLGPIGLFYASIIGGIIMTLLPFGLLFLFIVGLATEIAAITGLVILISIFYWLICIVWAIIAVNGYNKKLIAGVVRPVVEPERINTIDIKTNELKATDTGGERLSLKEWQLKNPHKSVNDFYSTYRPINETSTITNSPNTVYHQKSDTNGLIKYILIGVFLALVGGGFMYINQKEKGNNLSGILSFGNEEKEIINKIENVYFGLVNGAYSSEAMVGIRPEDLPFYNTDLSTLFAMGLLPYTVILDNFKLEPLNIQIIDISEKEATVKYTLKYINGNSKEFVPIEMKLKKIGGDWKLDGKNFLPIEQKKKSGKKRNNNDNQIFRKIN